MGSVFSQLTNPGTALTDPASGATMIGSPAQVRAMDYRQAAQQHPFVPGTPNPNPPMAQIGTPAFSQAAQAGALPGGSNAMSPGLSKAGKLVTLLTSGLQGALAGRAANEQATVASGGRRSGGTGMGFEAGYSLPWQRAGQQIGLEQQQANVEATRAQNAIVNTPQGPMPAWLARYVAPAIVRGQYGLEGQQARAGAQVQAAEIGQRFKAVPGVGLFDTNSRQVVPGTTQNVTITPEIAKDYQLPQEFVGKPMNVGQLASLERAQNQQTTTVTGAEGPALVEKAGPNKGKTTPLGLGSSAMGGVVPVAADPNNPGNITYAPKRQAVGMSSPQSAPTQTAKATARAVAPGGQVGNQVIAFDTAIRHADLLKQVATAMKNNDSRTLSGLKNRFQNEFGSSNLNDFNVVAGAYSREITKMLSGGHLTDSEISQQGATLPSNANIDTLLSAVDKYRSLAQSKKDVLAGAVQQGMQGRTSLIEPPAKFSRPSKNVVVEQ